MNEPAVNEPAPPRPARRDRGAWHARWMIPGGVLLIVAATLTLTSAGYGTSVRRGFAQRRSYDMIKPAVHRALPRAGVLGLGGLGLILLGVQLRRRGAAGAEAEARD